MLMESVPDSPRELFAAARGLYQPLANTNPLVLLARLEMPVPLPVQQSRFRTLRSFVFFFKAASPSYATHVTVMQPTSGGPNMSTERKQPISSRYVSVES